MYTLINVLGVGLIAFTVSVLFDVERKDALEIGVGVAIVVNLDRIADRLKKDE